MWKTLYTVIFKAEYKTGYYKAIEVFDNEGDALKFRDDLIKKGITVFRITKHCEPIDGYE